MSEPGAQKIIIDYYSDVLCVWAWVAQPRLEEVLAEWGDQVSVRYRYLDVFGDAHTKIAAQWGGSDGMQNFAAHLHEVAAAHPHAPVHEAVWTETRPQSSLLPHTLIKAAELVAGADIAADYALEIRRAFFAGGLDIADKSVLLDLATGVLSIDVADLNDAANNGSAMAAVSRDMREAAAQGLKGSPTWALRMR